MGKGLEVRGEAAAWPWKNGGMLKLERVFQQGHARKPGTLRQRMFGGALMEIGSQAPGLQA